MTRYGDAVNDALQRLDDLGYERSLGDGDLANHGPMAAETLATLGHGDAIPAWVETYRNAAPHYDPPTAHTALPDTDWREALGDISRAGDFEALILRQLEEENWPEVLTRWWSRLIPGTITGLTHGLIRTAHAVRSIAAVPTPSSWQLAELARGLGFWAARYLGESPQALPALTGTYTVAQAVAALPRDEAGPDATGDWTGWLSHTGHHVAWFNDALRTLGPGDPQQVLSDMTSEFAGICLAHRKPGWFPIPLLHGVTAPAAARLVLPHLPPWLHEPTLAALWQAQVTLTLVVTRDNAGESAVWDDIADIDVADWDELVHRAVSHGDEHVIKFTEACQRESGLRPDRRFEVAVAEAHRLIAPAHAGGGLGQSHG